MPKQSLTGRKKPLRRRFLDSNRTSSTNADLKSFAANSDLDKKGSKVGEAEQKPLDDDLNHDHERCWDDILLKRFPERLEHIANQVANELKDEEQQVREENSDLEGVSACGQRVWTYWFYFQYFVELEWERFVPLFKPMFLAAIVHHFIATLEMYEVCVGQIANINMDEDLAMCKKRDIDTKECLIIGEVVSERDIKRLEIYFLTVKALYYTALQLPLLIPFVYLACTYGREKDTKLKYDERIFMASQLVAIIVTLYVCLMPFILAIHVEIVNKLIIDQGEGVDVFGMQNDAIWIIHANMFRIMWLFFFRLMAIDMTLFQFFDWFFDQFEEDELNVEIEEIEKFEKLQEELKLATGDRKKEIEKKILEQAFSKSNAAAKDNSSS